MDGFRVRRDFENAEAASIFNPFHKRLSPSVHDGGSLVRILVIEDEEKTASFVERGLRESGFVVDVASDGEQGLHLAQGGRHDLVILDVMLPKRDGWSIVSELRRAKCRCPFCSSRRATACRTE